MARSRKILSITVFLLIVLVIWGGCSVLTSSKSTEVFDENGTPNLTNYDFDSKLYEYRYNWQSYPEKLYSPEDFQNKKITEKSTHLKGDDYEDIEYATHRLKLRLPSGKTYGLDLTSSDFSMRIFINGKEIDSVGKPGDSRETTVPRVQERTYYFSPENGMAEIIVQAANFVHSKDGAWPPVLTIGTAENITEMAEKSDAFNFLIAGCLLTSFLYHLGLFFLNRSRRHVLYFAISCLLLALMTKTPIMMFIPEYDWFVGIRVEYIVHFLTFGMLTLFLDTLNPNLFQRVIVRAYYIIIIAFVLLTLVLDPLISSNLITYFEIISLVMILYILVRMVMSLKGGNLSKILSFVGVMVISLFGFNDILFYRGISIFGQFEGQFFTTPVGMVIFVFCFSLVISIEYAETETAMIRAKEKEREYAERNEVLNRLNILKTEFLSNISHELKTPLSVMSSHAQLTKKHEEDNIDSDEYIINKMQLVYSEAQRMAAMVNQLLDISRIEEDRMDWNFKETDLKKLIDNMVATFYPVLNKNHNNLVVHVPENLYPVMCDSDRIEQVILNLVSNAVKFTRRGTITVSAQKNGDFIHVSVTDTGEGISADRLENIFDRYHTTQSKGDDTNTGTGLGLYISNRIIEAHGGTINIESEPGKGTKVMFDLPISTDTESENIEEVEDAKNRDNKRR